MKYRVKRHAVTQPLDTSYRLIPLTQGQNAIVDTEHFEYLSQFNWTAKWDAIRRAFYAVRRFNGKIQRMHRLLLGEPIGKEVDHKDRDSLNNRKNNLRRCTHAQNTRNATKRKDNTSGYRGVWFDRRRGKWQAEAKHYGKHIFIGSFHSAKDAAIARDAFISNLHGPFGVLNFPHLNFTDT